MSTCISPLTLTSASTSIHIHDPLFPSHSGDLDEDLSAIYPSVLQAVPELETPDLWMPGHTNKFS